ncbi:structural maintenance of chromosomes protein 6 isoform X2 [Anthonomus grandis grandis]|uniref:structural maintenance of chromosomes protein 6 isoform X2 n=1 Tax=Anthonomus grandis grandis TaxID=2921223 RepID=UPI002165A096|nr:structural maintenance of chromosomes protein 6 isoform X2 [Anthonomus grandis grandis]
MSSTNKSSKKRKPSTPDETITEKKRPKTQASTSNQESTCERRAGTVNYIILRNFMCHSLLEVDFTQNNISMVIGKNGSGKSAILTSLIVGLGGKASLTSRGTSVKGFVKVGKPSCNIEIQLCNEGPMAYRPRLFGNTITIIRNISAGGGGSYKIKSAEGEVISTSAKEVTNITTNLNIQVDNPICVLTQDTSRNFLSSNDPKIKFMLFMKATKLDVLETEYRTILSNKNECCRILDDKKTNFMNLQEEIRRLKRKIDGHQSIVNLKERKLALQCEMLWSEVKDVEKELEEDQKKLEKMVKKLEDFQANSNKKTVEIEGIESKIREYERQLAELKDQLEIQQRPQNDVKRILDELHTAYNEAKARRQGLSIEINSKISDVEYLQQEITNANENVSKVEQEKKERLVKLSRLQEKIKSVDDHLETARNELFQIRGDVSRKQEDEESLRVELTQADQKISREEASLQALNQTSGNSLVIYGRNIPTVKEIIKQNRHKFQYEPKGPLGAYIKLKDKKWAVAAEGYLGGGMLSAFTVDNQQDCNLLRQIFAQYLQGERQPTIITSKFLKTKHDVRDNLVQAPRDCISLYDALIIHDVVVSNCIVDQMSSENILLIPNGERAMELMSDRANVPRNCRQGITITGDKYYPDPDYKTYASTYHKARYLQIDTKEHIQHLQETIQALKTRRQTVHNQLKSLQRDINNQTLLQKELEDKIRRVTVAKQQIRKQYDELSTEAEPEVHNLQNLEQELQSVKTTLIEKNAELGQAEEQMREIQSKITGQTEKLAQMKKSAKSLEERLWPVQEKIKECESKRRQLSTVGGFDQQRLAELQRKVDSARSVVVLKQTEVTTKTKNASKFKRPEEIRNIPEINTEVQEITRAIARMENENEDIEVVSARHRQLIEKYKSVADIMKMLYKDREELDKAVDRRKKHYKLTENYFVTFMKHSFKKILEFRGFKGSIEINMDLKKLDLVVIPQQGSQGLTTTSNLSGGERSFSTVAFLYALWQCMDFPFYFLDEFDVYMDKLNRTKVIDILLHHANSKPDLQFVFLTPQDVSFVKQNVSILRLEDPERLNT